MLVGFRLPTGLAAEVEATYRAEVVSGFPDLAEDSRWEAGIRMAMAA